MIKISYQTLNDPMFVDGLRKLVNEPFHLQVSYWLGRIQDKVMSESRKAQAMWKDTLEQRVEWEGEGPARRVKDISVLKKLEEEFLSIEFDLGKINPIHVQDIHTAKLTPLQIMAIRPILTGLETLEDQRTDEATPENVTPIKKA